MERYFELTTYIHAATGCKVRMYQETQSSVMYDAITTGHRPWHAKLRGPHGKQ